MKILITGGTGWLGRKLVREYLSRGYDVTVLSRNEYNQWRLKQKYPQVKCILQDITKDFICEDTFDVLINCAAIKHVATGEEFKSLTYYTNVAAMYRLIDWAETHCKQFIYIGTDKANDPSCYYGKTKAQAEKIIRQYSGPMKVSIVKFGNLFGSSGSIVEILHNKIINNDNVIEVSDVNSERYFLEYDDAIKLIDEAIENGTPEVVGKYKIIKLFDLINAIIENPQIKIIGLRPGEKVKEKFDGQSTEYYSIPEIKKMFKRFVAELELVN